MAGRVRLSGINISGTEDRPGAKATVLVHLPLDTVAATPVNSRRNFGDEAELTELGESMRIRQLQPVVAVPRAAYLTLWPEHADQIGDAAHVLANGERRLRAARHVQLPTIDAIIRDDIADSRQTFLDSVFTENIQRRNFDPIEEARAVDALVSAFGTSQAVADHYKKSPGWVTQRRILLKLTRELQDLVSARKIPLAVAREIGKLAPERQGEAWRKGQWSPAGQSTRQDETFTAVKVDPDPTPVSEQTPAPASATQTAAPDAGTFTAVKVSPDPAAAVDVPTAAPTDTGTADQTFTVVKNDDPPAAASAPSSAVPEQREPEDGPAPGAVKDWADLEHVSDVIIGAMEPRQVYLLLEMVADRLKAIRAAV